MFIGINFLIKVGGLIASVECKPIVGVWGQSPQQVQGVQGQNP